MPLAWSFEKINKKPWLFRVYTWRIIPISKWLGSPPFISHLGHLEGEQPYLGDLLSMVINHLLTGMILQVGDDILPSYVGITK